MLLKNCKIFNFRLLVENYISSLWFILFFCFIRKKEMMQMTVVFDYI